VSEVFGNGGGESLATNPAGDAIVVWASAPDTMTKRSIKARRITADCTVGPTLTLSDGTANASEPEVAFAGDGRAVVVWTEAATVGNSYARGSRHRAG